MPPLTSRDRTRLDEAVEALRPRAQQVADEIGRRMRERLDGEDAGGDEVTFDALRRATLMNTTALLAALSDGLTSERMDLPDGALDLLGHVAPEPTTLPAVLRAFRIGGAAFGRIAEALLRSAVAAAGDARRTMAQPSIYRLSGTLGHHWSPCHAGDHGLDPGRGG